jgi:hypothetical protein
MSVRTTPQPALLKDGSQEDDLKLWLEIMEIRGKYFGLNRDRI